MYWINFRKSEGGFAVRILPKAEIFDTDGFEVQNRCSMRTKKRFGNAKEALGLQNTRRQSCCVQCAKQRAGWNLLFQHMLGTGSLTDLGQLSPVFCRILERFVQKLTTNWKKKRDTADSLSAFAAVRNQIDVDNVVYCKSNVSHAHSTELVWVRVWVSMWVWVWVCCVLAGGLSGYYMYRRV